MARIINNYSFMSADIPGAMVDPQNRRRGEHFYLSGKFSDSWTCIMGTDHCITSHVKEITPDGYVITNYSTYKLGTMSKDYKMFLDAVRRGMSIVVKWNIFGSREDGYYITGDWIPKRKDLGAAKIISKMENYLTVKQILEESDGKITLADEENVFVCWNSFGEYTKKELELRAKIADIKYTDFQEFNGSNSKPNLQNLTILADEEGSI